MKLFSEFEMLLEQDVQPWYVGVRVDPKTTALFQHLISDYNIPNPISSSKMHCTLIYSRKPTLAPQIQPHRMYKASLDKFDIFPTQDGKRCLVAKLTSSELNARHRQLMDEMQASYDFPQYLPHISLSYDVGESFNVDLMNPCVIPPVFLEREYCELLNSLETF